MKTLSRTLTYLAFVASGLSMTCASSNDPELPAASIEEYSYQIGVQVAMEVREQLHQSGFQLDDAAFLRGARDTLTGGQKQEKQKKNKE